LYPDKSSAVFYDLFLSVSVVGVAADFGLEPGFFRDLGFSQA